MKCPLCNATAKHQLLNLDCGSLDDSLIYKTAKIVACKKCGHVYNILSPKEMRNLYKYYDEESAPINTGSPDKVGDKTGSTGLFTLRRYDQLYNFISPYISNDTEILDAGCATGGFMDYLSQKGFYKLYGLDISQKYANVAKKKWETKVKVGNIESIPLNNHLVNLVVADQIIEHVGNPRKAFKEVARVLTPGGVFCVSVPDATRYDKNYFFDFFWFLLREHIQHFDIKHLMLLANQEGFELLKYSQYETPMMTEKMILPVLSAVFRFTSKKKSKINKKYFELKKRMGNYIGRDLKKLNKKKKIIDRLAISRRPVYAWGIGREFMYIYEQVGLKKCNIAGLIDANPYKQKVCRVDGKKIGDKSILQRATPNSVLVISALAHTKQIKAELGDIGYQGKVLNF